MHVESRKHRFEHVSQLENSVINNQIEKLNAARSKGMITDKEVQYMYLTFLQSLNLPKDETFNVYTNTDFTNNMATYNGWTNYETWVVNLGYDDIFTEVAADYRDDISGLAEHIQEVVEESLPDVEGLASDLLNAAMSEVNWYEIAKNYIDGLPEEEEEDETDA